MASTSKMVIRNDGRNNFNGEGVSFRYQGEENELYRQLWMKCAGPMVTVPRVGERVFYFPQGHIEQLEEACTVRNRDVDMPIYNLPYRILCKVMSVKLEVEADTDEVFAEITLLPEKRELIPEEERYSSLPAEMFSRFFTKKLAPTDCSSHGFAVPRRMAEECFPKLHMYLDTASQDLVAKDLHGKEWKFHHICRGTSKRHFLSTGWSNFLKEKNLKAGDTCTFIRGTEGQLYVGVHRMKRELINPSASTLSRQFVQHGILSTAFYALSTGSVFNVHYRPWTTPADYLIPYNIYMSAAGIEHENGTRVYMQTEGGEEDSICNRFSGIITGIEDLDPIRWPESEWRSLKVKWEIYTKGVVLPERVSPWSIELVEVSKRKSKPIPSASKRLRRFHPSIPFIVNNGFLEELDEYPRSRHDEVLQGQENRNEYIIAGPSGQQSQSNLRLQPNVEQGQVRVGSEKKNGENEAVGSQPNGGGKFRLFGVDMCDSVGGASSHSNASPPAVSQPNMSEAIPGPKNSNTISNNLLGNQCKNCCFHTSQSSVKVTKHGTALTRAVDLSRLNGYDELIAQLDSMFEFNGTLINKSCGWIVVYVDNVGDLMLLGDYPWSEFRVVVRQIFISRKHDVDQMYADAANATPANISA